MSRQPIVNKSPAKVPTKLKSTKRSSNNINPNVAPELMKSTMVGMTLCSAVVVFVPCLTLAISGTIFAVTDIVKVINMGGELVLIYCIVNIILLWIGVIFLIVWMCCGLWFPWTSLFPYLPLIRNDNLAKVFGFFAFFSAMAILGGAFLFQPYPSHFKVYRVGLWIWGVICFFVYVALGLLMIVIFFVEISNYFYHQRQQVVQKDFADKHEVVKLLNAEEEISPNRRILDILWNYYDLQLSLYDHFRGNFERVFSDMSIELSVVLQQSMDLTRAFKTPIGELFHAEHSNKMYRLH